MITKESFYYESRYEGKRIHAIRWQPPGDPRAILIIAHGMAEYIDRYDAFARYMAGHGILVAGGDYLGHGKTVGGQDAHGYICPHDAATVIVRDVHRLKKIIEESHPGIPRIVMGHSMGSYVIRNYISRYGSGIDGAILMGTGMPAKALLAVSRILAGCQAWFCGGAKPGKLLNKLAFGNYNKRISKPASGFSWLSVDEANVREYDAEPMCGFMFSINGFQTLFELVYRLHDRQYLARVPAGLPLLFVAGIHDPVGDYGTGPRLAAASLEKAGVKDITVINYSWGRHEILREKEKDEVYADIIGWIADKTGLRNEADPED